jgi:hypothetical protein
MMVPGTKTTAYRNEGIAIAKVKARLDALGIRCGGDGGKQTGAA